MLLFSLLAPVRSARTLFFQRAASDPEAGRLYKDTRTTTNRGAIVQAAEGGRTLDLVLTKDALYH